jgi:hypothetical protein
MFRCLRFGQALSFKPLYQGTMNIAYGKLLFIGVRLNCNASVVRDYVQVMRVYLTSQELKCDKFLPSPG